MKSIKQILKRLRKGDIAVVFAVLALSAALFAFPFALDRNLKAQIYLDGQSHLTVNLYEIKESQKMTVGGCTLLIEKDGVTFLESGCTDRLCINRGKLEKAGDTMACVPERVSVVLKAEKGGVDAVVF